MNVQCLHEQLAEFAANYKVIFTFVRMFIDVSQPLDYVFETFLIGYVVDEHYAHGPTVIRSGDCVETLLTGGLKSSKVELKVKKGEKKSKLTSQICVDKLKFQWKWKEN